MTAACVSVSRAIGAMYVYPTDAPGPVVRKGAIYIIHFISGGRVAFYERNLLAMGYTAQDINTPTTHSLLRTRPSCLSCATWASQIWLTIPSSMRSYSKPKSSLKRRLALLLALEEVHHHSSIVRSALKCLTGRSVQRYP